MSICIAQFCETMTL